ncbi:MAG: hypothetical protein MK193_13610 [Lentisphaeria bacterium]|nr:hypothetical protein [Lentisphaeria bacterium]
MILSQSFKKRPYRIEVQSCAVYLDYLTPMKKWTPEDYDMYRKELSKAVKDTLNKADWAIINAEDRGENTAYLNYVEKVRECFAKEFNISLEAILITPIKKDQLVLTFECDHAIKLPFYYMGIRLTPFQKVDLSN